MTPSNRIAAHFDPAGAATWLLGAALVVYLALHGGGYDQIVIGEVGIAVWVIALVGIASGGMSLPGHSRGAVVIFGLLAALAVWTLLAFIWTDSDERTAIEGARIAAYLGILVVAFGAAGHGRRSRQLLNGVATGVGIVVAIAVLSRLHPAWFPANQLGDFLPGIEIERRLAYPLGYSSAVGTYAGIAVPLLAGAASWSRTTAGGALAAAALPLAGLMLVLSSSGVGTGATVVGIAALLLLAGDRLPKLWTLLVGGAGTAILAHAVLDRAALDRGLPTPAAMSQGDEVLLIAIVVCLGAALAQAGVGLAVRHARRPGFMKVSRRNALIGSAVALLIAIPIAVAAGAPGEASDRWENFKERGANAQQEDRAATLVDTNSSGRYQYWQAAADAGESSLLTGIGPGTFEYYWRADPDNFGFVRDAHSLYMESFAELGLVGLGLTLALVLGTLGIGAYRAFRAEEPLRTRIAAATAAAAAVGAAAQFDWRGEIPAVPAIFLMLVVVITTDREHDPVASITARRVRGPARERPGALQRLGPRVAMLVLGIAALGAIWFPLRAAIDVRNSQIAVAEGDLPTALEQADNAIDAESYAATPHLQRALVLELEGDIGGAVDAARNAVDREPSNWRTWVTLSRLQARDGDAEAAVESYRRARELNPRAVRVRG
jgi:tetratricopeptide (TPR) repeat protein